MSNKKICIHCNIKPITGSNKKMYCDKCFIEIKKNKNKVDVMQVITEDYDMNNNKYILHNIEDILPKSYIASISNLCNSQQEYIKQLELAEYYFAYSNGYVYTDYTDYNINNNTGYYYDEGYNYICY
jgi:hypothetical protein